MITLNLPAPPKTDSARQAQWEETRSVFPIYLALAKHLQIEIPFPQREVRIVGGLNSGDLAPK